MVLSKMKEMAERDLGVSIRNTVITSPTYWPAAQRPSIRDAPGLAGLHVLRIVDSPNCTCIAYGIDRKINNGDRNVLVFDLGGGT